ncbi:MAG: hypothetical protein OXB94_11525 [Nitrospira sp.]|nr:hypothetical protein [Nitrospira sp.]
MAKRTRLTPNASRKLAHNYLVDSNFLAGYGLALANAVKCLIQEQPPDKRAAILARFQQWEERTKKPSNPAEENLQRGINSVCKFIEKP